MKGIRNRYLLPLLVFLGVGVLTYIVGFFYQKFVNNPIDFAALLFIIAFYVAALYFQLQSSDD